MNPSAPPPSHPPADASGCALSVRGLAKTYGRRKRAVPALAGVDLDVHRGEIFGLLGPNGAGKSTFVRCVLGICTADAGETEILGRSMPNRTVLARVGYLPEGHLFPRYLTAFEVLDHFAALAGMSRADRRKRADALLDRLGLSDVRDRSVVTFSKGMAQRLGVANALMNDPDLVFLDEPTDGLDPLGRREVRDLIAELRSAGKTVLLNSHLLGEVEEICDRVAILIAGRIVRIGTVAEFGRPTCRYWLDADDLDALAKAARPLAERVCRPPDGHPGLLVDLPDREAVVALIDKARAAGIALYAVSPIRMSLEEAFLQIIADVAAGAGGEGDA